jgi:tetratricopeptide (TPR) repeat protein
MNPFGEASSHEDHVNAFVRAATLATRSGYWDEAIERRHSLKNFVERWLDDSSRASKIVVFRRIRLLIDVFDRCTEYRQAEDCLRQLLLHTGNETLHSLQLDRFIDEASGDTGFRLERLWVALHFCVFLHRKGHTKQAFDLAMRVNSLAGDITHAEAAELRIRVLFTIGRLLQSSGRPVESETYFEQALVRIHAWRPSFPPGDLRDRTILAMSRRFHTAVVLASMARSALDQGALGRAYRQLIVAKMAIDEVNEDNAIRDNRLVAVPRAYIDYLSGCVHRQKGDFEEAVTNLDRSLTVFKSFHRKLLERCQLELAQVSLDKGDTAVDELLRNVSTAGAAQGLKSLIAAKSALLKQNFAEAEKLASAAIRELPVAQDAFNNHVWSDRQAVAYAVAGESSLLDNRPDVALHHANNGLRVRSGGPPIDVVDHAWLLVVRARAYIARLDFMAAVRDLEFCVSMDIENTHIRGKVDAAWADLKLKRLFYIPADSKDFSYYKWERRLREFLLAKATENGARNKDQAAEMLGASSPTLYKWDEDFRTLGLLLQRIETKFGRIPAQVRDRLEALPDSRLKKIRIENATSLDELLP